LFIDSGPGISQIILCVGEGEGVKIAKKCDRKGEDVDVDVDTESKMSNLGRVGGVIGRELNNN